MDFSECLEEKDGSYHGYDEEDRKEPQFGLAAKPSNYRKGRRTRLRNEHGT